MGYRHDKFAPGEIYHIFTRGVEKRDIFLSNLDRQRFLALLIHCLPTGEIVSFSNAQKLKQKSQFPAEGKGLVDLLCYCLMDNHLHLLLKENSEGGISLYMQRLLKSYAKYFNAKNNRSGSLFVNPFKAVLVTNDEQFLQVSRYIHLNPYVAHMIHTPFDYPWSSLGVYVTSSASVLAHSSLIKGIISVSEYKKFILDMSDYIRSLSDFQYLTID